MQNKSEPQKTDLNVWWESLHVALIYNVLRGETRPVVLKDGSKNDKIWEDYHTIITCPSIQVEFPELNISGRFSGQMSIESSIELICESAIFILSTVQGEMLLVT